MNNYTKYFLVEHDKMDTSYFFIYRYVSGRGYTILKWAEKKNRNKCYMDMDSFNIENINDYISGDWHLIYEDREEEEYRTWHDLPPTSEKLILEISEEIAFTILL